MLSIPLSQMKCHRQSLQLRLALGAIILQMLAVFAQFSQRMLISYTCGALCTNDGIGRAGKAVEGERLVGVYLV